MADEQVKAPAAPRRKKAGEKGGESGNGAAGGAVENGGEALNGPVNPHPPGDAVVLQGDGTGTALPPIEEGEEQRERTDEGTGTAPVIERMETMASEAVLNTRSLVFDTRDFLLDQIKARPKPWSVTPFDEQRDVAAACEHAAKELVRKIVEAIATDNRTSIRALLESYSEKDGLKASLKIKTFDDEEALAAVVGLHRAVGKHVMITVASADDYAEERRDPDLEEDQRGLDFEAGSDEHPEDDSDLSGEPTVRINLEEGMVQKLQEGGDPADPEAWDDVRAAKPEELAAERERIADFEPE